MCSHNCTVTQLCKFDTKGVDAAGSAAVAEADASSPAAEGIDISWDIDITETAEQTHGEETDGGEGQAGSSELLSGSIGQQATWPESVVRLTQDTSCRTALLDDLHELSAFLSQQMQEVSSGEGLKTSNVSSQLTSVQVGCS